MDRTKYIRSKAKEIADKLFIDGVIDPLDLYLIETNLDEVFQTGADESDKKEK